MTERIAPNPYSPYANALPDARHLLPVLFFMPPPPPGTLALTGCDRMAVVPVDLLKDVTELLSAGRAGELPPGLCADCVSAATGEGRVAGHPQAAPAVCEHCDGPSSQGRWCALCRQELHDAWWPTRERTPS